MGTFHLSYAYKVCICLANIDLETPKSSRFVCERKTAREVGQTGLTEGSSCSEKMHRIEQ